MDNIFDPDYVQNQQIASLQRMAAEQNSLRVQRYRQASSDWITTNLRNRDLGLPITALPTVPKKITVTDGGEWVEAPFDDLQPPVLPAPVVAPSSGSLRPPVVPPDRTDQMLVALAQLNAKVEAVLALLKSR